MKQRGDKTRAEERHIKMFVQHHLTLDSAEHRNLDARSRRSKDRRTFSLFRGEPILSLSERKERATGGTSGEQKGRGGVSLVMPDAKFYERCPLPNPSTPSLPSLATTTAGAVFHVVFFLPCKLFFYLCSFPFRSLPFSLSLSCHFSRSSGVSIVNPTVVSPSRVRAQTNPARKGKGRNLGAESNVPSEQKENAGTDWCPCRPGYSSQFREFIASARRRCFRLWLNVQNARIFRKIANNNNRCKKKLKIN